MEFTQPRGRKRKERYDYEPPEQTDGPQPLTQLEEHTAYSYEHNEARKTFLQVPVSPSKPRRSKPEEAANSHLPHGQHSDVSNWEGFGFDGGLADTSENQDGEEEREKRCRTSDDSLLGFIPLLDTIISEMLRHESLASVACSSCGSEVDSKAVFRCRDCFSNNHVCRSCLLGRHTFNPLHRVEHWNGQFFDRTSLKALGLRIQLHHAHCPRPDPSYGDDFVIIDSNGIHSVSLDFCNCAYAPSHFVQLLRHRLFPATTLDPRTAATFGVLETFQMLSFTAKVNAHDFLHALERRTDNTGTYKVPDRYAAFLRIIHVWRHARLMKRAARGHDPSGIAGTPPGGCAVLCPACPYPKINLPPNWMDCPPDKRFLFQLFLAMDANFRLKHKNISTDEHDPGLNRGYAYFVEETKFKEFPQEFAGLIVGNDNKSSCNNYDAIKSAGIRGGRGTAASGVGAAQCARHDMKRPLGVGDLQLGEKYPNMDYFVIWTLTIDGPIWIVISYDIACQWSINFALRCERYGPQLDPFEHGKSFTFLVPKFHLPAHILSCQVAFSFNYHPGVGRTEGEAPERGWADSNGLAYSTREMGPGSRRDTLDDHFSAVNWTKVTKLSKTFTRRAKDAIQSRQELVDAFKIFDSSIPEQQGRDWSQMVEEWEHNPSSPNPFMPACNVLTSSTVRLRLAAEDAEAVREGKANVVYEDVTPSIFVLQGIELEESHLQRSKVVERGATLQRKIDQWISLQGSFMPPTMALRQAADKVALSTEGPEQIPLFLPSSLCSNHSKFERRLFVCEQQYRVAQAETALHQLRGYLLLRTHMWKSKQKYGSSHRYMTRSNTLLNDLHIRITRTADRYRHSRVCLSALGQVTGDMSWEKNLKPLERSDVQGLTEEDEGGEGKKQLKWIWTTPGTTDDQQESTQSALRIEWCKARARAHRWQEECLLLAEEMRRVLAFWDWEVNFWEGWAQAVVRPLGDITNNQGWEPSQEVQGRAAYAWKQVDTRRRMAAAAEDEWRELRVKLQVMEGQQADVLVKSCHLD
ncbi:hypothetical protein BKA70DRAFT_1507015 [Coprinopsis sp. MPI-PUGE-AT-0042]|nr:hypothetical protein BKA70DRAFT_1507015 [Coprinopsis sp. MPI-PUGE-AT-0042]